MDSEKIATLLVSVLVAVVGTVGNVLVALIQSPKKHGKTKMFMSWLLIILATLVIPTGLLTWAIAYCAAALLRGIILDMPLFIGVISLSTGILGSGYPILWAFRLYPVYSRLLEKDERLQETVVKRSTASDEPHQSHSDEYQ